MSVAWVGAGIAAIGTIGSMSAAEDAEDAAYANMDAQTKIAMKQLEASTKQADDLLAFNKQVYEEGKTRQAGIDAINKKVVDSNLAISEKAAQRADETYDFYKTSGRPVIEKALSDAQNFDSAGNIAAARGRASADVAQAYANTESQGQRTLARLGVRPSMGRFVALQQKLLGDKAATMAGAVTNAEQGIRDQAIGLRQQASNIAHALPAQSMQQNGQSSGTGVAAAGVAGSGAAQNAALARDAMSGMEAGAGIYGRAGSVYGNLAGQSMQALNGIQANANSQMAGWGNLMGQFLPSLLKPSGGSTLPPLGQIDWDVPDGFANGGKVEGPGTGTSDSIPARLSAGEYVIPADVVKKKGTEFFDKLLEKNHKPVNLGAKR